MKCGHMCHRPTSPTPQRLLQAAKQQGGPAAGRPASPAWPRGGRGGPRRDARRKESALWAGHMGGKPDMFKPMPPPPPGREVCAPAGPRQLGQKCFGWLPPTPHIWWGELGRGGIGANLKASLLLPCIARGQQQPLFGWGGCSWTPEGDKWEKHKWLASNNCMKQPKEEKVPL